jgi:hypothetical protein
MYMGILCITNVSEEIDASVCRVAHEKCAWVAALRSVLGLAWVTVLEVM